VPARDFVENFRDIIDHDGPIEWSLEILAVGGERFAVARITSVRWPVDFTTDILIVVELNDRWLATPVVAFDPEDLVAALAEMERRSTEAESAE
jgi:hypothetical protein